MKRIPGIFLMLLLLACMPCAKAGDPVLVKQTQTTHKKTSVLLRHTYKPAIVLCQEYKRKQIAGYALMPIGAGALAGGTYMLYKGAYSTVYQYNHGIYDYKNMPSSRHNVGLVCGGAALFVAGISLLPGGLIMSGISSVKYCRNCRASGVYLSPAQSGLGLACNF